MPAPEPDLDAIVKLLDPASLVLRQRPRPDWAPHRDAAAVALCWLVGVRPSELAGLRRRDWRAGDVLLAPLPGRPSGPPPCGLPVLDPAREVVGAWLRAAPELPEAGPLLLADDGSAFGPSDLSALDARLKRLHGMSLAFLAGRFRLYVERTRAEDGTVEALAGRGGTRAPEPDIGRLRRALRDAHPFGRGVLD